MEYLVKCIENKYYFSMLVKETRMLQLVPFSMHSFLVNSASTDVRRNILRKRFKTS